MRSAAPAGTAAAREHRGRHFERLANRDTVARRRLGGDVEEQRTQFHGSAAHYVPEHHGRGLVSRHEHQVEFEVSTSPGTAHRPIAARGHCSRCTISRRRRWRRGPPHATCGRAVRSTGRSRPAALRPFRRRPRVCCGVVDRCGPDLVAEQLEQRDDDGVAHCAQTGRRPHCRRPSLRPPLERCNELGRRWVAPGNERSSVCANVALIRRPRTPVIIYSRSKANTSSAASIRRLSNPPSSRRRLAD